MFKDRIFINLANQSFSCPHCQKQYLDSDDKYLNRCNKNKNYVTATLCVSCERRFVITYDYMGNMVTYIPKNNGKDFFKTTITTKTKKLN